MSDRRRSSARRCRDPSPACLTSSSVGCDAAEKRSSRYEREAQVVGRMSAEHSFVDAARGKHTCKSGGRIEALPDLRHPRLNIRGRGLWRDDPPHFVQHQHAIDHRRQPRSHPVAALRRLDQTEVERRVHVRLGDDLTGKNGQDPVDNLCGARQS